MGKVVYSFTKICWVVIYAARIRITVWHYVRSGEVFVKLVTRKR